MANNIQYNGRYGNFLDRYRDATPLSQYESSFYSEDEAKQIYLEEIQRQIDFAEKFFLGFTEEELDKYLESQGRTIDLNRVNSKAAELQIRNWYLNQTNLTSDQKKDAKAELDNQLAYSDSRRKAKIKILEKDNASDHTDEIKRLKQNEQELIAQFAKYREMIDAIPDYAAGKQPKYKTPQDEKKAILESLKKKRAEILKKRLPAKVTQEELLSKIRGIRSIHYFDKKVLSPTYNTRDVAIQKELDAGRTKSASRLKYGVLAASPNNNRSIYPYASSFGDTTPAQLSQKEAEIILKNFENQDTSKGKPIKIFSGRTGLSTNSDVLDQAQKIVNNNLKGQMIYSDTETIGDIGGKSLRVLQMTLGNETKFVNIPKGGDTYEYVTKALGKIRAGKPLTDGEKITLGNLADVRIDHNGKSISMTHTTKGKDAVYGEAIAKQVESVLNIFSNEALAKEYGVLTSEELSSFANNMLSTKDGKNKILTGHNFRKFDLHNALKKTGVNINNPILFDTLELSRAILRTGDLNPMTGKALTGNSQAELAEWMGIDIKTIEGKGGLHTSDYDVELNKAIVEKLLDYYSGNINIADSKVQDFVKMINERKTALASTTSLKQNDYITFTDSVFRQSRNGFVTKNDSTGKQVPRLSGDKPDKWADFLIPAGSIQKYKGSYIGEDGRFYTQFQNAEDGKIAVMDFADEQEFVNLMNKFTDGSPKSVSDISSTDFAFSRLFTSGGLYNLNAIIEDNQDIIHQERIKALKNSQYSKFLFGSDGKSGLINIMRNLSPSQRMIVLDSVANSMGVMPQKEINVSTLANEVSLLSDGTLKGHQKAMLELLDTKFTPDTFRSQEYYNAVRQRIEKLRSSTEKASPKDGEGYSVLTQIVNGLKDRGSTKTVIKIDESLMPDEATLQGFAEHARQIGVDDTGVVNTEDVKNVSVIDTIVENERAKGRDANIKLLESLTGASLNKRFGGKLNTKNASSPLSKIKEIEVAMREKGIATLARVAEDGSGVTLSFFDQGRRKDYLKHDENGNAYYDSTKMASLHIGFSGEDGLYKVNGRVATDKAYLELSEDGTTFIQTAQMDFLDEMIKNVKSDKSSLVYSVLSGTPKEADKTISRIWRENTEKNPYLFAQAIMDESNKIYSTYNEATARERAGTINFSRVAEQIFARDFNYSLDGGKTSYPNMEDRKHSEAIKQISQLLITLVSGGNINEMFGQNAEATNIEGEKTYLNTFGWLLDKDFENLDSVKSVISYMTSGGGALNYNPIKQESGMQGDIFFDSTKLVGAGRELHDPSNRSNSQAQNNRDINIEKEAVRLAREKVFHDEFLVSENDILSGYQSYDDPIQKVKTQNVVGLHMTQPELVKHIESALGVPHGTDFSKISSIDTPLNEASAVFQELFDGIDSKTGYYIPKNHGIIPNLSEDHLIISNTMAQGLEGYEMKTPSFDKYDEAVKFLEEHGLFNVAPDSNAKDGDYWDFSTYDVEGSNEIIKGLKFTNGKWQFEVKKIIPFEKTEKLHSGQTGRFTTTTMSDGFVKEISAQALGEDSPMLDKIHQIKMTPEVSMKTAEDSVLSPWRGAIFEAMEGGATPEEIMNALSAVGMDYFEYDEKVRKFYTKADYAKNIPMEKLVELFDPHGDEKTYGVVAFKNAFNNARLDSNQNPINFTKGSSLHLERGNFANVAKYFTPTGTTENEEYVKNNTHVKWSVRERESLIKTLRMHGLGSEEARSAINQIARLRFSKDQTKRSTHANAMINNIKHAFNTTMSMQNGATPESLSSIVDADGESVFYDKSDNPLYLTIKAGLSQETIDKAGGSVLGLYDKNGFGTTMQSVREQAIQNGAKWFLLDLQPFGMTGADVEKMGFGNGVKPFGNTDKAHGSQYYMFPIDEQAFTDKGELVETEYGKFVNKIFTNYRDAVASINSGSEDVGYRTYMLEQSLFDAVVQMEKEATYKEGKYFKDANTAYMDSSMDFLLADHNVLPGVSAQANSAYYHPDDIRGMLMTDVGGNAESNLMRLKIDRQAMIEQALNDGIIDQDAKSYLMSNNATMGEKEIIDSMISLMDGSYMKDPNLVGKASGAIAMLGAVHRYPSTDINNTRLAKIYARSADSSVGVGAAVMSEDLKKILNADQDGDQLQVKLMRAIESYRYDGQNIPQFLKELYAELSFQTRSGELMLGEAQKARNAEAEELAKLGNNERRAQAKKTAEKFSDAQTNSLIAMLSKYDFSGIGGISNVSQGVRNLIYNPEMLDTLQNPEDVLSLKLLSASMNAMEQIFISAKKTGEQYEMLKAQYGEKEATLRVTQRISDLMESFYGVMSDPEKSPFDPIDLLKQQGVFADMEGKGLPRQFMEALSEYQTLLADKEFMGRTDLSRTYDQIRNDQGLKLMEKLGMGYVWDDRLGTYALKYEEGFSNEELIEKFVGALHEIIDPIMTKTDGKGNTIAKRAVWNRILEYYGGWKPEDRVKKRAGMERVYDTSVPFDDAQNVATLKSWGISRMAWAYEDMRNKVDGYMLETYSDKEVPLSTLLDAQKFQKRVLKLQEETGDINKAYAQAEEEIMSQLIKGGTLKPENSFKTPKLAVDNYKSFEAFLDTGELEGSIHDYYKIIDPNDPNISESDKVELPNGKWGVKLDENQYLSASTIAKIVGKNDFPELNKEQAKIMEAAQLAYNTGDITALEELRNADPESVSKMEGRFAGAPRGTLLHLAMQHLVKNGVTSLEDLQAVNPEIYDKISSETARLQRVIDVIKPDELPKGKEWKTYNEWQDLNDYITAFFNAATEFGYDPKDILLTERTFGLTNSDGDEHNIVGTYDMISKSFGIGDFKRHDGGGFSALEEVIQLSLGRRQAMIDFANDPDMLQALEGQKGKIFHFETNKTTGEKVAIMREYDLLSDKQLDEVINLAFKYQEALQTGNDRQMRAIENSIDEFRNNTEVIFTRYIPGKKPAQRKYKGGKLQGRETSEYTHAGTSSKTDEKRDSKTKFTDFDDLTKDLEFFLNVPTEFKKGMSSKDFVNQSYANTLIELDLARLRDTGSRMNKLADEGYSGNFEEVIQQENQDVWDLYHRQGKYKDMEKDEFKEALKSHYKKIGFIEDDKFVANIEENEKLQSRLESMRKGIGGHTVKDSKPKGKKSPIGSLFSKDKKSKTKPSPNDFKTDTSTSQRQESKTATQNDSQPQVKSKQPILPDWIKELISKIPHVGMFAEGTGPSGAARDQLAIVGEGVENGSFKQEAIIREDGTASIVNRPTLTKISKGDVVVPLSSKGISIGNGTPVKAYADGYGNVEEIMKYMVAQYKNAGTDSESEVGAYENPIKREVKGMLSQMKGSMSYMLVSKIQQTVSAAIAETKALDDAMVNLRMVTGGTKEETYDLISGYNNMAKQLGVTTKEVTTAANEFLRMGYNAQESGELIKQAMVLSKVGMMDTAKAQEYLASAMKGYKLDPNQMSGVIDMATSLDMNYAVDAGYIFEAMARAANSANTSKIDISELQSMIAIAGEVTQFDSSMVGTGIRTALARYNNVKTGAFEGEDAQSLSGSDETEGINDTEKVLSKMNIKIREDDGKTWRSYSDVLGDVAEKWKTMSDLEKNAITTAMFGQRQREIGLTIFENYDRILSANELAMNSNGSATKKYEAYQDGLTAATSRLTATWEGLITELKGQTVYHNVLEFFSQLLNIINALVKAKPLLIGLLTASTAMKFPALVSGFGKFSNAMFNLNPLSRMNPMAGYEKGSGVKGFVSTVGGNIKGSFKNWGTKLGKSAEKTGKEFGMATKTNNPVEKATSAIVELTRTIQDAMRQRLRNQEDEKIAALRAVEDEKIAAIRGEEDEALAAKRAEEDKKIAAIRAEEDEAMKGATAEEREGLEAQRYEFDESLVAKRREEDESIAATRAEQDETLAAKRAELDKAQAAIRLEQDESIAATRAEQDESRIATQAEINEGAMAGVVSTASMAANMVGMMLSTSTGNDFTEHGATVGMTEEEIQKKSAIASSASTVGSLAGGIIGSFFGPVGTAIGSGIGSVAGGAIAKIWSSEVEREAKRIEAANKHTEEAQEAYNKTKSAEVDAKRYDELARGVGSNGQNLSLSDEEYTEFLDLSTKLSEAFPDLISHVDELGNVFLDLGGEGKSLTQISKELLEQQQRELADSKIDPDQWKSEMIETNNRMGDIKDKQDYWDRQKNKATYYSDNSSTITQKVTRATTDTILTPSSEYGEEGKQYLESMAEYLNQNGFEGAEVKSYSDSHQIEYNIGNGDAEVIKEEMAAVINDFNKKYLEETIPNKQEIIWDEYDAEAAAALQKQLPTLLGVYASNTSEEGQAVLSKMVIGATDHNASGLVGENGGELIKDFMASMEGSSTLESLTEVMQLADSTDDVDTFQDKYDALSDDYIEELNKNKEAKAMFGLTGDEKFTKDFIMEKLGILDMDELLDNVVEKTGADEDDLKETYTVDELKMINGMGKYQAKSLQESGMLNDYIIGQKANNMYEGLNTLYSKIESNSEGIFVNGVTEAKEIVKQIARGEVSAATFGKEVEKSYQNLKKQADMLNVSVEEVMDVAQTLRHININGYSTRSFTDLRTTYDELNEMSSRIAQNNGMIDAESADKLIDEYGSAAIQAIENGWSGPNGVHALLTKGMDNLTKEIKAIMKTQLQDDSESFQTWVSYLDQEQQDLIKELGITTFKEFNDIQGGEAYSFGPEGGGYTAAEMSAFKPENDEEKFSYVSDTDGNKKSMGYTKLYADTQWANEAKKYDVDSSDTKTMWSTLITKYGGDQYDELMDAFGGIKDWKNLDKNDADYNKMQNWWYDVLTKRLKVSLSGKTLSEMADIQAEAAANNIDVTDKINKSISLNEARYNLNKEIYDYELKELTDALERRNLIVQKYQYEIDNISWGLDIIDEDDFEKKNELMQSQMNAYINQVEATRTKMEILEGMEPKSSAQAQKIKEAYDDGASSIKQIQQAMLELEKQMKENAVNSLTEAISKLNTQLDRYRKIISGINQLGMSDNANYNTWSTFGLDFSDIDTSTDEIQEKRELYNDLIGEQETYQEKSLESQKKYLDLLQKESKEAISKTVADVLREFPELRDEYIKYVYQDGLAAIQGQMATDAFFKDGTGGSEGTSGGKPTDEDYIKKSEAYKDIGKKDDGAWRKYLRNGGTGLEGKSGDVYKADIKTNDYYRKNSKGGWDKINWDEDTKAQEDINALRKEYRKEAQAAYVKYKVVKKDKNYQDFATKKDDKWKEWLKEQSGGNYYYKGEQWYYLGDTDGDDKTEKIEVHLSKADIKKAYNCTDDEAENRYNYHEGVIDEYRYKYASDPANQQAWMFVGPPANNARGTSYFKGGLSWVAEQGRELIIEPDGDIYLANKKQILSLEPGTRIYNNRDTEALLKIGYNAEGTPGNPDVAIAANVGNTLDKSLATIFNNDAEDKEKTHQEKLEEIQQESNEVIETKQQDFDDKQIYSLEDKNFKIEDINVTHYKTEKDALDVFNTEQETENESHLNTIRETAATIEDGIYTDLVDFGTEVQILWNNMLENMKDSLRDGDSYDEGFGFIVRSSEGDVGTVAQDTYGLGYGAYGFQQNGSADELVRWMKENSYEDLAAYFGDHLSAEDSSDTNGVFATAWKEVALKHPDRFLEAQTAYIKEKFYEPVRQYMLKEVGFDADQSRAVQEAILSAAVQHGTGYTGGANGIYGAPDIIKRANLDKDMKESDIVSAIYDSRRKLFPDYTSRYDREEKDVLNISGGTALDTFLRYMNNKGKLSSEYGPRDGNEIMSSNHKGIDYSVPEGTEVRAVTSGKVIRAENKNDGYGECVIIEDGDGNLHYYAHLQEGGLKVTAGNEVQRGTVIALSGNTGKSTGPHVHYGIQTEDGTWVNPADFNVRAKGDTKGHQIANKLLIRENNKDEIIGYKDGTVTIGNNPIIEDAQNVDYIIGEDDTQGLKTEGIIKAEDGYNDETATTKFKVNTQVDDLNVRSSGSLDAEILDTLAKGTEVVGGELVEGWRQVTYGDNQTGWVSDEYLQAIEDLTEAVEENTEVTTESTEVIESQVEQDEESIEDILGKGTPKNGIRLADLEGFEDTEYYDDMVRKGDEINQIISDNNKKHSVAQQAWADQYSGYYDGLVENAGSVIERKYYQGKRTSEQQLFSVSQEYDTREILEAQIAAIREIYDTAKASGASDDVLAGWAKFIEGLNESLQGVDNQISTLNENILKNITAAYELAKTIQDSRKALTDEQYNAGIAWDKLATTDTEYGNLNYFEHRIAAEKALEEEANKTYGDVYAKKWQVLEESGEYTREQIEEILKSDTELIDLEKQRLEHISNQNQAYSEQKQYIFAIQDAIKTIADAEKAIEYGSLSQIDDYYDTLLGTYDAKLAAIYERMAQPISEEEYRALATEAAQLEREAYNAKYIDYYKDQQSFMEKQYNAMVYMVDEYKTALNEEKEYITERYDEEIQKLKETNNAKERSIKLTELQDNLNKAQKEKKRVYRAGVGFVYESDREELTKAKDELDQFYRDDQIDSLEKAKEKELKILDDRVQAWEKYLAAIEKVYKTAERRENMSIANDLLGTDSWEGIWDKLNSDLTTFTTNLEQEMRIYKGLATDFLETYESVAATVNKNEKETLNLADSMPGPVRNDGKSDLQDWRYYQTKYGFEDYSDTQNNLDLFNMIKGAEKWSGSEATMNLAELEVMQRRELSKLVKEPGFNVDTAMIEHNIPEAARWLLESLYNEWLASNPEQRANVTKEEINTLSEGTPTTQKVLEFVTKYDEFLEAMINGEYINGQIEGIDLKLEKAFNDWYERGLTKEDIKILATEALAEYNLGVNLTADILKSIQDSMDRLIDAYESRKNDTQSNFGSNLSKLANSLMGSSGGTTTYNLAKNAKGTSDFEGGFSLVGEEGPEIINLPKHSAVYTAKETVDILNKISDYAKNESAVQLANGFKNNPYLEVASYGNGIFEKYANVKAERLANTGSVQTNNNGNVYVVYKQSNGQLDLWNSVNRSRTLDNESRI